MFDKCEKCNERIGLFELLQSCNKCNKQICYKCSLTCIKCNKTFCYTYRFNNNNNNTNDIPLVDIHNKINTNCCTSARYIHMYSKGGYICSLCFFDIVVFDYNKEIVSNKDKYDHKFGECFVKIKDVKKLI